MPESISAPALAAAILAAPGWAQVAITMPDPSMRERGADELARAIVQRLTGDDAEEIDQLRLSL